MPILRYKFGQERGIVKENAGFDDSIFRDQYVQALRLTNAFVRDKESETLKCVAFCGDRGEGKTSCMTTTQGIIEQVKEKSDAYSYVDKIGCKDLANTKCSVVEVTDPSFSMTRTTSFKLLSGSYIIAIVGSRKNARLIMEKEQAAGNFFESECISFDSAKR